MNSFGHQREWKWKWKNAIDVSILYSTAIPYLSRTLTTHRISWYIYYLYLKLTKVYCVFWLCGKNAEGSTNYIQEHKNQKKKMRQTKKVNNE